MNTFELNGQLAELNGLDEAISRAVKLQRENGDAFGALDALRDIVNRAIGMYTRESSFESFRRSSIIEKAFDKARLVCQRTNQPSRAVANGVVSYFLGIKRMSACADYKAGVAAEERSPRYQVEHGIGPREANRSAKMWETEAKEELAQSLAALSDAAIFDKVRLLLKKMKLDVALADKIVAAVSQPQDNPWEMFNAVMSAIGQ